MWVLDNIDSNDNTPRATTSIKVFSANVQSILSKLIELEVIISEDNFDVLCVCEHWCSIETKDLAILPGFLCASMFCRTQQTHGGVAVFVREELKYTVIDLTDLCQERHFEVAGVVVNFPDWSIALISLYRVPNGDKVIFFNTFEKLWLRLARMGLPIVVCGDLNLDVNIVDPTTTKLLNLLRSLDCYCANSLPTRNTSMLDNVISNLSRNLVNVTVLQPPISDHCALVTTLSRNVKALPISGREEKVIPSFTESNQNKFLIHLMNTDWSNILSEMAINHTFFDNFLKHFLNIMDVCFPLKTVKVRPKSRGPFKKIRLSREVLMLKEEVSKCHGLYMWALKYNTYTPETRTQYVVARKIYKQALVKFRLDNNAEYIASAPNSCKAAWEIINATRGASASEKVNHNLIPDDFNNAFLSSVRAACDVAPPSIPDSSRLLRSHVVTHQRFNWSPVSCDDVQKCVMAIKSGSSKDIYDISGDLIKKVLPAIIEPLTVCINECFMTGQFPDLLKVSKVVPIFKKGNPALAESYRPISLVPVFSKIVEKAVIHQLNQFFETNYFFSKFQFGFRRGLSTVDAVEVLVSEVLQGFGNHNSTLATLCDLTKAFDCVSHDILINKLQHYGITGVELKFFRSYLENRTQRVCLNHKFSETASIESGVPQGSVLGPFLFLVLINDLPCNVACKSVIFADDSTFFSSGRNTQTVLLEMGNYLDEASFWFNSNGLLQNNSKTQNILFTLSSQQLPSNKLSLQPDVKLLGITLDSKLSWVSHVNSVCSRLSRVIFLLNHLKKCVNKSHLKMAYFSFFHSIIIYGITLCTVMVKM
uniref:Reverse transcriptase domain-containing protein n=1 Tax=Graphocephala atropunctata TaxID=36148 RepID=A0A1B6MGA2_9HEMI